MREVLIGFFFVLTIILITAKIILEIMQHRRNKSIIAEFTKMYEHKELGTYKCEVKKNFWSPGNRNFYFNLVSLYRIENGLVLSPIYQGKLYKKQLKPFVIGNNLPRLWKISVNNVDEVIYKPESTIFKVTAPLNTHLEIEIFGTEKIFNTYSSN